MIPKFLVKLDLSKSLSVLLFISFSAGITFGYKYTNLFVSYTLTILAISIAYVLNRRNRSLSFDVIILIIFFFLGILWQIPSSLSLAKAAKFLGQDNNMVLLVTSLPESTDTRNTFNGQIRKINDRKLQRKIKVRVIDYTKDLEYLGVYQVKGKLIQRKYNDYKYYCLWVKKDSKVIKIPPGFWKKIRRQTIDYVFSIYSKNCNSISNDFLGAVFLGRRELIKSQRLAFSDAGVSHLLAISGLHIGLFSLVIFFTLRFFSISFRISLAISLLILYGYVFLTDISPSTMRATIMYSVLAISFFLKRKYDPLNSLALAGIIALLIYPQSLFSIGFQLSFISVFSIILGFKIFKLKLLSNPILNYIKQVLFCSFFVTLGLMPIVSYYFGKIYLLSIFYNIIFIPFFTLILAINFLLLIFSPISFIAQSLGACLSLIIPLFIKLVYFLGSIRFSYISYKFSPAGVLAYYISLSGICVYLTIGIRDKISLKIEK